MEHSDSCRLLQRFLVTLNSLSLWLLRLLLPPFEQKFCSLENGNSRAESVVSLEHYCISKSFAAVQEALATHIVTSKYQVRQQCRHRICLRQAHMPCVGQFWQEAYSKTLQKHYTDEGRNLWDFDSKLAISAKSTWSDHTVKTTVVKISISATAVTQGYSCKNSIFMVYSICAWRNFFLSYVTWFHLNNYTTSQNSRLWSAVNKHTIYIRSFFSTRRFAYGGQCL